MLGKQRCNLSNLTVCNKTISKGYVFFPTTVGKQFFWEHFRLPSVDMKTEEQSGDSDPPQGLSQHLFVNH